MGLRFTGVLCLLLSGCLTGFAQYYPTPQPMRSTQLVPLLLQLKKSRPDTNKVKLLLDLANVYFNKPVKQKHDLDSAMHFAKSAGELSSKLHYPSGYDESRLFIANIFTVRNDMKSAEIILGELTNDTTKIDLLLNLCFKYRQRENDKKDQDYQQAISYAEQARNLSAKNHLRQREIMASAYIAFIHADKKDPKAENEMLEVIKQYRAIGYPYLHYVYNELAGWHYLGGNPDKALYYSQEILKSMRNTGDSVAAADFYALHALICLNNEEYETALEFGYKAIDSYRIIPGYFPISATTTTIPRTLRKLKRYDEALAFLLKIRKEFPAQNDLDEISYTQMISDIYRDMKQFSKAEKYALLTLNLMNKNGISAIGGYKNLGQIYLESGQYAKAKPYLYKVLEFPKELLSSGSRRHLYYMLFLVDSATGDYLSAIRHKNEYNTIEDYNLRQVKEKEVQKLNVQYETEKKQTEIKIKDQSIKLLEQSAVLQQSKLRQATLLRNFTIGGIVMLLIITGLLYKQYRQKQKTARVITETNKVISQKNRAITQKNDELEHVVAEKEWLLKEVNHRVKNNLHTVICLLESQAANLKNDALTAIQDSQHRIYAMSLIHQKLYQSDVKVIDMKIYLPQFIRYLEDSFGDSNNIRFVSHIEPVTLSASQAVPIALIVNEAVTNSIKYAFPNNRRGKISISLSESEDHIIKLEVADDGIGMDPESIHRESNSLGIALIKGLSKEIHAGLEFEINNGTNIKVTFRHDSLMGSNISHLVMFEEKEVFS